MPIVDLIRFCRKQAVFVTFIIFQLTNCNEMLLTNKVNFFGKRNIQVLNVYFNYEFDVKITINPNISAFPNILTITNFAGYSTGFASFSPTFPIRFYYDDSTNFVDCVGINSNTSCTVAVPNGKMGWHFDLVGPFFYDVTDSIRLYVHDGYLYNSQDGTHFTEDKKCFNYCDYLYGDNQNVCAVDFVHIELPVTETDQCNNFQTNTLLNDEIKNVTINILINYLRISNESWNIAINIIEAPAIKYTFSFEPNNAKEFCSGDNDQKKIDCKWKNFSENANFEMLFSFEGNNEIIYDGIYVGEIIYAFGEYYRSFNILYTEDDPCWHAKSKTVPFSEATYDSSFCCTSFGEDFSTVGAIYTSTEFASSTTESASLLTTSSFQTLSSTSSIDTDPVHDTSIPTATSPSSASSTLKTIKNSALKSHSFHNIYIIWQMTMAFFCYFLCDGERNFRFFTCVQSRNILTTR